MHKLDINDTVALVEYEKFLFRAFPYRKDENMESYFKIDLKGRRYTPVLGYDKITTYINKPASLILSSVSVISVDNPLLQLEIDGFKVDKKEKNVCEGFHLANIGDTAGFKKFLNDVLVHLGNTGLTKCYITCDEKRLSQYTAAGFIHLDSLTKENGYKINLMCFDLRSGFVSII